jgi:hypothetical protein
MKFFTKEWHSGELPDDEPDHRCEAYTAHLQSIESRLPPDLHYLTKAIYLHDGIIISAAAAENVLEIIIQGEHPNSGEFTAQLRYEKAVLSEEDSCFLGRAAGNTAIEILYDEVDESVGRWIHRMLFWPYHEISIEFAGFTVAVAWQKQ